MRELKIVLYRYWRPIDDPARRGSDGPVTMGLDGGVGRAMVDVIHLTARDAPARIDRTSRHAMIEHETTARRGASEIHTREGDDPVAAYVLADDGTFPNNGTLPVVVYRDAIELGDGDAARRAAAIIEDRFHEQRWGGVWRNGIFGYHHYHSTAHEVLCIATGTVRVQLGGDAGPVFDLVPGDVVVIPAGVAHKNLDASDDLVVVGAYPPHQIWDINTGGEEERPRADENIAAVPLPETDPVLGPDGPLMTLWSIDTASG